jgi:L-lysine exporter family protein LysE/ArgO
MTVDIVRWFGVAFLTWYGLSSLWRAFKAESLDPGNSAPMTRRGAITRIMALTWLNPHVYLDTVLLLGSIGNQQGDYRWWFALGAAIGSTVWFSALGFGAQYANRWLRSERSWKILEIGIGFTMLAVAVQLALM